MPADFPLPPPACFSDLAGEAHARLAREHACIEKLFAQTEAGTKQRDGGVHTVMATGGSGMHLLRTWQVWRADADQPARLHYLWLTPTLPDAALLASHARHDPALAKLTDMLLPVWPLAVPGSQRLLLDNGNLTLTLVIGNPAELLPRQTATAEAFWLFADDMTDDGDVLPPALLARLHRHAAADATLGMVVARERLDAAQKALRQCGFASQDCMDLDQRRLLLSARRDASWTARAAVRPEASARRAIVIGAGLAGSAVCERLTARGWRVTLLERHARPAQEASGNPAGIVMPLLSRDDNLASQLARSAYLFALHHWQQLGGIGPAIGGDACGVLQLVQDEREAAAWRASARRLAFPPTYARWMEQDEVRAITGTADGAAAWFFAQGGWVQPASVCAALLAACGDRLDARFHQEATTLVWQGTEWEARAQDGTTIASAPVVVLASGTAALRFEQAAMLPLQSVRGQITLLPASRLPALPHVVCGDAYVTRLSDGSGCIGASYDMHDDANLRRDSQDDNLRRLARMLPGLMQEPLAPDSLPLAGRVGFRCVSGDRLPLVGALPDMRHAPAGSRLRDVPRLPGLYGVLGFGSRGLIWSSLCAEVLASLLHAEPLPIDRDLFATLDPARFVLKAHRRGDGGKSLADLPPSILE